MSSEELKHIRGGWRLLNTGSEATSSLETPSVSEGKSHATCALLFMCFLRHPLLGAFGEQLLGQMKVPSSQCGVSDVTNFGAAGWTHCSSPCS